MYIITLLLFVKYINTEIRFPSYDSAGDGVAVDNVPAVIRYRIKKADAECEEFNYLGSGSNFNNFRTLDECRNHLITTPLEMLEACKRPLQSQPDSLCEKTAPGVMKYFFKYEPIAVDAATGKITPEKYICKGFYSRGCEDTNFIFEKKIDCENACLAKRNEIPNVFDCTLPPKLTGPDPDETTTYDVKIIYDSTRNQCVYGVVDISQSRGIFNLFSDCVNKCITNPPLDQRTECTGPPHQGTCKGPITLKYYYNITSKSCEPFYSNECTNPNGVNQFDTVELCAGKCPIDEVTWRSVKPFCRKSPDPGKGILQLPRWYYSNDNGDCLPFIYKGIGGNRNRFENKALCLTSCSSEPNKVLKSPPPLSRNIYGENDSS